jgi:outer membrane protein assembly factor BamB
LRLVISIEDGIILSQHDSQPLGGDYPTSIWEVGEVVEDEHIIVVKGNALVGGYRLEVGMYRLSDGRRLEVFDAEGKRLPGDRVLLGLSIN